MQSPAPAKEKNINYPEIQESQLENGLQVLAVQDDRFPRAFLSLVFPVGKIFNPDDNFSLVSLAVEMMRSGTESRSANEISHFIDRLAINYDSDVSMEHSFIGMTFLEKELESAVALLADIVLKSTFPEDELEKIRVRWQSHLIAQRSQPDFLANERIFKTLYANHPYSKISITSEHLTGVTQKVIETFYRSHFSPRDAFLLFAGPVDLSTVTNLGNHFLGEWGNKEILPIQYPKPSAIDSRLICLIHRPHSVQSQLLVAGRALPKNNPDYIALKVVNQVLGGGANSRLFLNLREDKGYTYGAYSHLKSYRSDGLFLAGASVKTEVTLQCVEEILKEINQLHTAPPKKDELARCQQELIGGFIRQMETSASVGTVELNRRIHGLPKNFYSTFIEKIRDIGENTALEIAQRFFDPEKLVVTVVADRNKVESKLAQMGELHVYDTEGNLL